MHIERTCELYCIYPKPFWIKIFNESAPRQSGVPNPEPGRCAASEVAA